jgi:hypothetical protein
MPPWAGVNPIWPENETMEAFVLEGKESSLELHVFDKNPVVDGKIADGSIPLRSLVDADGQPTWCVIGGGVVPTWARAHARTTDERTHAPSAGSRYCARARWPAPSSCCA